MPIEVDVYDVLTASQSVTDLVGTGIFPIGGEENLPKPYISYQRISTVPVRGLLGNHNFATYRIQINCCGRSYAETKAIAQAVRVALEAVQTIVYDNEYDRADEEAGAYTAVDFLCHRTIENDR